MNLKYSLLFILSSAIIYSEAISNGSFVSIKNAPYYISIITKDDESFCGGTIISEYWILTAAHCSEFKEIPKIRSGVSVDYTSGLHHDIEKIIIHGDYEDVTSSIPDNDIALIKLKKPISFNELQQPIKIRSKPPKVGETVSIVGFGFQGNSRGYPKALKAMEVPVITDEACHDWMSPYITTDNVFCGGNTGVNVCSGDSGGPVVIDDEIVGVVSFANVCIPDVENIGAYTRLYNYLDWISKHTKLKF